MYEIKKKIRKYKPIARGVVGLIPGLLNIFMDRREVIALNARYCYSVWMRHLVLSAHVGGNKIPDTVAEIGPGASLGVGIAALISGAEKYFAFDVIKHADVERNLKVFHELVLLFMKKEPIPGDTEFPSLNPALDSYVFPLHLLSDNHLKKMLEPDRLKSIESGIMQLGKEKQKGLIMYCVPWDQTSLIQQESVDLIFSQAALEHVMHLEKTYSTMYVWLKPQGLISHQIDLKAHETSTQWYGHRTFSDALWWLIMKGRSYPINRVPYCEHKLAIEKNRFKRLNEIVVKKKVPVNKSVWNPRFRHHSQEDLSVASAYVLAQKQ